ncbi:hypothetical protein BCR39DRAFT_472930 [Naematelia encephala]|uniref:DUF1680-domain-containing protein n=1 Tax=Naematelia encephala TaxID=71784 RepID=A0A1Y2AM79_9TREE|nr:hypothetical protein BCR39DRAFT_472930 [Naematelia encephala]
MGNRTSVAIATPVVTELDPDARSLLNRPHPQETVADTVIGPESFYGKIRSIYSSRVLKTQLEQLRKQGSYDAFKLGWNDKYNINKLNGAKCLITGSPPVLYWDSDVGKWIEAACYFLTAPDGHSSPLAAEFKSAIDELVDMIVKAQQPDGYVGTYFTVVDKKGRLMNLRDMHEMYCCGHLLEAALAHHRYTGSRKFLDCMIKYINLLSTMFGPGKNQLHGYPGHPELELAVLRLYSETKDPRHYAFGKYLVAARGVKEPDLGGRTYFVWEAQERRKDTFYHATMESMDDGRYHLTHAPLHQQDTILGHSVRALYLVTATADLSGPFLRDAKRLWTDCVDNKMYPTGGAGSEPRLEGFSEIPHFLPHGTDEGGCYAETCASIALMMVSERLLSHEPTGKVRDVLELCLVNTVLGGANLDGKKFFYDNRLATYDDETAERQDWFDVCCCPPNLTRTMGMLGGYTWCLKIHENTKTILLDVYLYLSATRTVQLPTGRIATVEMESGMPWKGTATLKFDAPPDWKWEVRLPKPDYASNFKASLASLTATQPVRDLAIGFVSFSSGSQSTLSIAYDMPVRLLSPHPATRQDTLVVSRGPIIYTAESFDNPELDKSHPHFANLGLLETTTFEESETEIGGVPIIALCTRENAYLLRPSDPSTSMRAVDGKTTKARTWTPLEHKVHFVPFFARANRGEPGRIRTAFQRVGTGDIV